jgi:acyl dehydratase
MVVRNKLNQHEKKMVDDFHAFAAKITGRKTKPNVSSASPDSAHNFAMWADPWNPLWNDDEYAKKSCWKAPVVPPVYLDCVVTFSFFPSLPPAGGFMTHNFLGEDWELFRQVYIGDSFTVERKELSLDDISALDGSDKNRIFSLINNNCEVYNQRDELVAKFKAYMDITIWPDGLDKSIIPPFKDHVYTKDEWDFINRIIKQEKIQGAASRYWEDVIIGDELTPCTIGPTTPWDMVAFTAARQETPFWPMRWWRENAPMGLLVPDPVTNVTHMAPEWHIVNERAPVMGDPRSFHYFASAKSQMIRIISNWMGDSGLITVLKARHLRRTYVGDTQVVRGKVTAKRKEDGKYLVDVDVWMDNLCRGNVTESAFATVSLPSKKQ